MQISLRRWHRNLQVFVASFAYLGRTQFNYDIKKQLSVGNTTKELDQWLSSSRFILCELEVTINATISSNNLKELTSFTREEMAARLNFQTMKQELNGVDLVEPYILDLKFTKHYYRKLLASMRKILENKLSKKKNREVRDVSLEYNSVEDDINAIDDNDSSIDVSAEMRSDSNAIAGESFETSMEADNQLKLQLPRTYKKSIPEMAN